MLILLGSSFCYCYQVFITTYVLYIPHVIDVRVVVALLVFDLYSLALERFTFRILFKFTCTSPEKARRVYLARTRIHLTQSNGNEIRKKTTTISPAVTEPSNT